MPVGFRALGVGMGLRAGALKLRGFKGLGFRV